MTTRSTPLTPDEARAVLWPFASPRRPIGELLATGRITEADLWRATRVAYSRRVKSACAILRTVIRQPIVALAPGPIDPVLPPVPAICPICGDRVRPYPRWDSAKHGPGWRCETHGLTHCLQLRYLDQLKAVYAPDAWVIPPQGEDAGVRRRDLACGPIGYLPQANL